jgi:hypothetical protein
MKLRLLEGRGPVGAVAPGRKEEEIIFFSKLDKKFSLC